jgi:putative oxidoreductase
MIGGGLIVIGLFTRWAAFITSGEMAIGYFMVHAPKGFFPYVNGGNLAILYCFVFLYLVFAGPGPISLDALLKKEGELGIVLVDWASAPPSGNRIAK